MKKLFCFFIFLISSLLFSTFVFCSEFLELKSSVFPDTINEPSEIPLDWFEKNDQNFKEKKNVVIWSEGVLGDFASSYLMAGADIYLHFDTGQVKKSTVYSLGKDGQWHLEGITGNLVPKVERSFPGLLYGVKLRAVRAAPDTRIRIKTEPFFLKPFSVKIMTSADILRRNDYCLIGYSLFFGFQLLSFFIFLFNFKYNGHKLFLVSALLSLVFLLFVLSDSNMDIYLFISYSINGGDFFNYNIMLLFVMCVLLIFKESMQFHFFGRDRNFSREGFWFFLVFGLTVLAILMLPSAYYIYIFGQLSLFFTCVALIILLVNRMIVDDRKRPYVFAHICTYILMLIRTLLYILRGTYPDFEYLSFSDNDYLIPYIVFAVLLTVDSFLYLGFTIEKRTKKNNAIIIENDIIKDKNEAIFSSLHFIADNIHKTVELLRSYANREDKSEVFSNLEFAQNVDFLSLYNDVQNALLNEKLKNGFDGGFDDVIHLRPLVENEINTCEAMVLPRKVKVDSSVKINSKFVVKTNRTLFSGLIRMMLFVADNNASSNTTIYIKSNFSNGSFSFSVNFECNAPHEKDFNVLLSLKPQNKVQEQLVQSWGSNIYLIAFIARLMNGSFTCIPAKNGLTIGIGLVMKSSVFYPKLISEKESEIINTSEESFVYGERKSVLIADFNLGFRISLADRFNKDFTVYTAGNGQDTFELLYNNRIDALIVSESISVMDVETLLEAKAKNPSLRNIPVFVIVDFLSAEKSVYFRKLGALYVTDNPLSSEDLVLTVKNTLQVIEDNKSAESNGGSEKGGSDAPVKKSVKVKKNNFVEGLSEAQNDEFTRAGLTKKEKQIAVYISQGMSDKEISDITGISASTVAVHNRNIFKKLGIHKRSELLK